VTISVLKAAMFITFEGPEGGGKSTQIRLLAEFLRGRGFTVETMREPGGTPIGDQIRHVLHDTANTAMAPAAEVLLYSASRAQLVNERIRPALAAGRIVLCDRYADSTMAYQGYGRGLDLGMLATLTGIATGGLTPDLTLLLDLDVSDGLSRRLVRGEEMNRLDLEAVAFHERVREGYSRLASADPGRWVRIQADRTVELVAEDIREAVLARLSIPAG
jgi:dTMP kinase